MKATLAIMGRKYEGDGDSAREAIASIPFNGFARDKAVLTVGEKSIVLPPLTTQRIFSRNPQIKEIAIKNISIRF